MRRHVSLPASALALFAGAVFSAVAPAMAEPGPAVTAEAPLLQGSGNRLVDADGATHRLAWNTWDCASGPSLISDYDGTPTAYGQGLKDHLATVAAAARAGRD